MPEEERFLPEPPPDPELVAAGWERRFTAAGPRAAEAAGLYRQLGYEVLEQAVRPAELPEDCTDCRIVSLLRFTTIYTRKETREKD